MAAATEDRLDVFTRQLRHSIEHDLPVEDPANDEFYESTLAEVNADGTAAPLTHTDGEDDSGQVVLAVLDRQDDAPFTGKFKRDRGGADPLVNLQSGAIIEFEISDSTGDHSIGDPVYAVDNQTVRSSQSSGTSGDNAAQAGVVYEVLENTVKVYVPGILD